MCDGVVAKTFVRALPGTERVAMAQWPGTLREVRGVVRHWVDGCGTDVVRTLFELERGLDLAADNGFLVSPTLTHAIPMELVQNCNIQHVLSERLVRLGCYLAFHNHQNFANHVYVVELHKARTPFWEGIFKGYSAATSPPTIFAETLRCVQHPTINRLVWRAANSVMSSCDAVAVCERMCETLNQPVVMSTQAAHASLVHFIECAGLHVTRCGKGIGVLQYPGGALTMSRQDHLVWMLLAVFYSPYDELPSSFRELKEWIRDHSLAHEMGVIQTIMKEWRLAHTAQQTDRRL